MDYPLKNRFLCGTSEILETVSQQAVDLDFTLPDYCADIEKILKCSLIPKIYTRHFSAGQLRIDGASVISILYCDSTKSALRCCEQTVPFSATIPVNSEASENIILTTAKSEYLNCRALSPRRLSAHGAFSLYASVIGKKTYEVSESCEDSDLQIRSLSEEVCELCEFTQELFSVNEAVHLRARSNVETIVRSQVYAALTDIKESGDKIILSGEATLRMLYISDSATGETDQFVYVFPFSQSIGSKDSGFDTTDIRLDVLCYDLMLKSEMLSDEQMLNIDLKMCATVMGYKKKNITYISDAYSVKSETELKHEALPLCLDIKPINTSGVIKTPLSLGDKRIRKIVDIFNEDITVFLNIIENNLQFSSKINVCILAITEEGEIVSIERQLDMDIAHPLDETFGYVTNGAARVTSISYRMSDNNEIELRLDLQLFALGGTNRTISQVTSAQSTGDSLSQAAPALTLYYALKDECVWDIAKRYHTPIKSICDENSLEEETLADDRMLLILRA